MCEFYDVTVDNPAITGPRSVRKTEAESQQQTVQPYNPDVVERDESFQTESHEVTFSQEARASRRLQENRAESMWAGSFISLQQSLLEDFATRAVSDWHNATHTLLCVADAGLIWPGAEVIPLSEWACLHRSRCVGQFSVRNSALSSPPARSSALNVPDDVLSNYSTTWNVVQTIQTLTRTNKVSISLKNVSMAGGRTPRSFLQLHILHLEWWGERECSVTHHCPGHSQPPIIDRLSMTDVDVACYPPF